MHITGMTIGGIPPFTEPVEFELDEPVNVFMGPNATGKTKILRCLYGWEIDPYLADADPMVFSVKAKTDDFELPDLNVFDAETRKPGSVPMVHIPAIRWNLPNLSAIGDDERELLAWRRMESWHSILLAKEHPAFFDGKAVYQALYVLDEGLHRDAYDSLDDSRRSPYWGIVKLMTLANDCVKDICDLVQNERLSHYLDDIYFRDSNVEAPIVQPGMGVYTDDVHRPGHPTGPIFMGDLSSGTQSTFLWILYLAIKVAQFYDFAGDWDDKPGILLIDEIENHLHPSWQRRVIPALRKHFPNIQIFATTHSPFVVAGLKAGQVHLLNRDENGVVRATTNTDDILGWTADEILRVFMGVDDPTDEATARAARALRRLRDEGQRADKREEEERQADMLRLRQIVNRAELAGPRVAENDRFLANLDAILERHRQSQDLNQENA